MPGAALQDGAAQEAEAAGAGGAGNGVVIGLLVVGLPAPGTELGAYPLLLTTIVPPEIVAHHSHLPAKQMKPGFLVELYTSFVKLKTQATYAKMWSAKTE